MKKKKILMFIALTSTIALITTGCGKSAELKNGAKVAVSIDGNKFTASEYYEEIKEDNISKLINMIDKKILEEEYQTTDSEDEAVENQISQIKEYYGSDESTYKSILSTYFGVENEEE